MRKQRYANVDAAYWWRAYQAFVGRTDDAAFAKEFAALAREFYGAAVAAEALSPAARSPNAAPSSHGP